MIFSSETARSVSIMGSVALLYKVLCYSIGKKSSDFRRKLCVGAGAQEDRGFAEAAGGRDWADSACAVKASEAPRPGRASQRARPKYPPIASDRKKTA